MTRYALPPLALLALFIFPYPIAGLLIFLCALAFPLSGLVLGLAADILYYSPGAASVPWGTMLGALATLIGLLVRRFVKTRIMEA